MMGDDVASVLRDTAAAFGVDLEGREIEDIRFDLRLRVTEALWEELLRLAHETYDVWRGAEEGYLWCRFLRFGLLRIHCVFRRLLLDFTPEQLRMFTFAMTLSSPDVRNGEEKKHQKKKVDACPN